MLFQISPAQYSSRYSNAMMLWSNLSWKNLLWMIFKWSNCRFYILNKVIKYVHCLLSYKYRLSGFLKWKPVSEQHCCCKINHQLVWNQDPPELTVCITFWHQPFNPTEVSLARRQIFSVLQQRRKNDGSATVPQTRHLANDVCCPFGHAQQVATNNFQS